ncbi:MAG: methyltransferase [Candidatus Omnitrophica bacterium]|nr:methyltransferase [Candidatus Omnitrophota bacterium]
METGVMVIRILLATVLGAIVGFEREVNGCAAGLRTHILVCLGSAVFMVASVVVAPMYGHLGAVDPSRIAANIVTGVGFLGAGAIIRYGASIRGLTTAASIWAVAAVGLVAGAGMYIAAVLSTVLIVCTLFLSKLEERMELKRGGKKLIIRLSSEEAVDAQDVHKIISAYGGSVRKVEKDRNQDEYLLIVDLMLSRLYRKDVVSELLNLSGVHEVEWK